MINQKKKSTYQHGYKPRIMNIYAINANNTINYLNFVPIYYVLNVYYSITILYRKTITMMKVLDVLYVTIYYNNE